MPDTLSYICAAIEYAEQEKSAPASLRPIYQELVSVFANMAIAVLPATKIVPSKPAPRGGYSL